MPIISDPNARYEYVLARDRDLEPQHRAVFVFKYLSVREWRGLANLVGDLEKLDDGSSDSLCADVMNKIVSAVAGVLMDWKNVCLPNSGPVDYSKGAIEDVLTPAELMELLYAASQQTPGLEDKKKSDSQSE